MITRKINYLAIAFLLAVSLGWPLNAQQSQPAKLTRHPLWKIEGQRCTVYLLGSVHLLKKEDYPLPQVIESAFTNAQIAVFEADVDKMHEEETQMKMMRKAQLPPGEKLQQHLSADTYQAFKSRVEKAGLTPAMFEPFKPMMAVSVLELAKLQQLGFDPQYGLDQHFATRAHEAGKEIVALETLDFQIDLFTSLPSEDADSAITAELKEIDHTEKDLAEMITAWRTGDSANMEKLLHSAMQESPALFKRLVTDRNKNWLPKIQALANGQKNAIVIVGAGHLVGKEGLVELVKKAGLKVTQE